MEDHNVGDASSIGRERELNGEGNYASTSHHDITNQDIDLGLTLPPSDLLFDPSFLDDTAFLDNWMISVDFQEWGIHETENLATEVPVVHFMFDEYQLSDFPNNGQQLTDVEQPLPSQDDESVRPPNHKNNKAKFIEQPSATTSQIQSGVKVTESGVHSPADSGYGISIAPSCEHGEEVNDGLVQIPQLSEASKCDHGNHIQIPFTEQSQLFVEDNLETRILEVDDSSALEKSDSSAAQPNPQPTNRSRIPSPSLGDEEPTFKTPLRMPAGFQVPKLSKRAILKKGMTAGWFCNSSKESNPQQSEDSAGLTQVTSIMDSSIPLAMAVALAPNLMRPAILETMYRMQSHLLSDPNTSSKPPPADTRLRALLEQLFQRYQTKGDSFRNTVIIFIMEKLLERHRKSPASPALARTNGLIGESKSGAVPMIPSMDFSTLEDDLAKLVKAMERIKVPKTQQELFDATATTFKVLERNAAHIKELLAGKPHLLALEKKNEALSMQVNGLAAKCEELQYKLQYKEVTSPEKIGLKPKPKASETIRMPPEFPSPPKPFLQIPADLELDLSRPYRVTPPPSNTAWMCLLTTTGKDSKRCEAVNRTWLLVQSNDHRIWMSRQRCVRCQQEHKGPASKYYLHESEVKQLGGVSKGRGSNLEQLDLPSQETSSYHDDKQAQQSRAATSLPRNSSPYRPTAPSKAPHLQPDSNPIYRHVADIPSPVSTPYGWPYPPAGISQSLPPNQYSAAAPRDPQAHQTQPQVQPEYRLWHDLHQSRNIHSESPHFSGQGNLPNPHYRPNSHASPQRDRPRSQHDAQWHAAPQAARPNMSPRNHFAPNDGNGTLKRPVQGHQYGNSVTQVTIGSEMQPTPPIHSKRTASLGTLSLPGLTLVPENEGQKAILERPYRTFNMPPNVGVTPISSTYDSATNSRKRSAPEDDDEVIISGSITSNPTTTDSPSSSSDSPEPKKRCRKLDSTHSTPTPSRPTSRRKSYNPVPTNTAEYLQHCLPGLKRSWMKPGASADDAIAVDDDEEEAPATPDVAKRKRSTPKKLATVLGAGVTKKKGPSPRKPRAKKVAVVPEKAAAEDPFFDGTAPLAFDANTAPNTLDSVEPEYEVQTPAAGDGDDMDSLFGSDDDEEPEAEQNREMTDEVADEWGAELEAIMGTPDAGAEGHNAMQIEVEEQGPRGVEEKNEPAKAKFVIDDGGAEEESEEE